MRPLAPLALLLVTQTALAQPGPGRPLTLERARALGDRIARDDRVAQAKEQAPEARVQAARDRAEAFDELYGALMSPVAGGAGHIDDGAEAELRARTGVSFAEFRRSSLPAWRRCAELVRTLHLVNDDARSCLRRASEEPFGSVVALDSFALTTREMQSGDWDGAIAQLNARRGEYDADLTIAVALIGQGKLEAADQALAQIIRATPARPEAHYNRALLAASRRYTSEQKPWIVAQDRRAFVHFRAFLCLREGATLPFSGDAWLAAGRGAEDAERRLTGKTHWSWPSAEKRARPFLPQPLLPREMRDDEGARMGPSSTCKQVLAEAL
jgi:hypothetical protein